MSEEPTGHGAVASDGVGGSTARERTPAVRVIGSAEILDGAAEIIIDHEGEQYRLRHTRKGKLILTK